MKAHREMGPRRVPFPEEISFKLSDTSLVSGNGPVWKKEFLQSEERCSTIQQESGFREVFARFAKQHTVQGFLGQEEAEIFARSAVD